MDSNCVMTLWNIQIRTDKQVMSNQLDVVVVDKVDKKAVLTDAATPNDSNIRKNENDKFKKYLEQLEIMWRAKSSMILLVLGALGAVNPRQKSGFSRSQEQHPWSLFRRCNAGNSKASRTPELPGLWLKTLVCSDLNDFPFLKELDTSKC